MNELEKIKKRIDSEKKYGDVSKACKAAGVSPSVFQTAMKKTSVEDLTSGELSVVLAYRQILDERSAVMTSLRES